jgi:putative endopeptidase
MVKSSFKSSDFDFNIRPQDDLYAFVNNNFESRTSIPADETSVGTFTQLRKRSQQQIRKICETNPDTLYGKLYFSYMDKASIIGRGAAPLLDAIYQIAAVERLDTFSEYCFNLDKEYFLAPFGVGVFNNPKDPSQNIMHFAQGGLGLPDESYYRESQFAPIRMAYLELIDKLFKKLAFSYDPESILRFETELAALHWDLNKMRDVNLTTNLMKVADLQAGCPSFDFVRGISAWGIQSVDEQIINIETPEFFTNLGKVWNSDNFEVIKAWNMFQVAHSMSRWLTDDFRKINFEFAKVLSGLKKMPLRWKSAVNLVNSSLGEAVGKTYVQLHFDQHHKRAIDQLVQNLLLAYRESISDLDWLDQPTREQALRKLAKITVKIGYPDKFESYSGLILDHDLIKNLSRIEKWEFQKQLRKVGKPVDPTEWLMSPQTVNAYYHPMNNEIVFPAAILQPPFFNPDVLLAENYGAIGAVIGHEIGHGFDDQGSEFDADGNLKNWWSDEVKRKFASKTAQLVAQYQGKTSRFASAGFKVDGKRTLGENIGDLGGLTIALKAYLKAVDSDLSRESTADFNALQIFFFSYARAWRNKIRQESAETLLATDVHAPTDLRANITPTNLAEFYQVFGVKSSDKLYLPPTKRVSIW